MRGVVRGHVWVREVSKNEKTMREMERPNSKLLETAGVSDSPRGDGTHRNYTLDNLLREEDASDSFGVLPTESFVRYNQLRELQIKVIEECRSGPRGQTVTRSFCLSDCVDTCCRVPE